MDVKQEGLGYCPIHRIAIMQAIGVPGVKGLCFACVEDAKEKTGYTVVVKSETGDMKASPNAPEGRVEFERVDHMVDTKAHTPPATKPKPKANAVVIEVTLDELYDPNIIKTLLVKINEGIDDMPPPATIKEAKRVFKLQERIEELIQGMVRE